MEKKKVDGRGGRREGAGRPKGDSRIYSFRVPGHIAELIEKQPNKTVFIRNCVEHALARPKASLESLGQVVPAVDLDPLVLPFTEVRVVAGFPVPLDNDEHSQDIDILRLLCPHPEASFLIRVEGESMRDADIHSGDIVIVDKSNRNPSERDIAVCELNGEYTLKHFVSRDGCGWLVPENPAFPEIRVNEGDDFSIWGTVTYVIHRV